MPFRCCEERRHGRLSRMRRRRNPGDRGSESRSRPLARSGGTAGLGDAARFSAFRGGGDYRRLNRGDHSMKRLNLGRAVFIASIVVVGAGGKWLFGTEAAGQAAAARGMPMFEVDSGWPKVPA